MKKTYVHPFIRVVELGSTVSVLAGSDKYQWDPDDTAVVKKDYDEDDEFL